MDKTLQEQITELSTKLENLTNLFNKNSFRDNTVIDKKEVHTPTADIVMQSSFINRKSSATVTIANPAVVTSLSHNLVENQAIFFTTTGALPTGITAGTTYYVLATSLTANTFKFSATQGGTAVITSGSQSGVHAINAVFFRSARIVFTPDASNLMDQGGIFAVNDVGGESEYSEIDFTHSTEEVGIRLKGQGVGNGGRTLDLFAGIFVFQLVDTDGGGDNYISTDMMIDMSGVAASVFTFAADITAAGAYKGRIPITVGGVTKYLHYFDA